MPSNPWDRLPGETDKAWLAFGKYLDLGPERTLSALAGQRQSATKGRQKSQLRAKASGTLHLWFKRHRWRERAHAWDERFAAQVEAVKVDAATQRARVIESRRATVDEEAWEISQALKLKGMQLLGIPHQEVTEHGPEGKTLVYKPAEPAVFRAAAQILKIAEEMGRASVGLASRFSVSGRLPEAAAARIAGVAAGDPATTSQDTSTEPVPAALAEQWREQATRFALEQMEIDDAQP